MGQSERSKRTIAEMISKTLSTAESGVNWGLNLPFVVMAHRSSVHETTGEIPNMDSPGRQVSMPIDVETEIDPATHELATPNNIKGDSNYQPAPEIIEHTEVAWTM